MKPLIFLESHGELEILETYLKGKGMGLADVDIVALSLESQLDVKKKVAKYIRQ